MLYEKSPQLLKTIQKLIQPGEKLKPNVILNMPNSSSLDYKSDAYSFEMAKQIFYRSNRALNTSCNRSRLFLTIWCP